MKKLANRIVPFFICLFLSFIIISYEQECIASEYDWQVAMQKATILDFFKVINKRNPTVKDFIGLFGENNEAEMALIFDMKKDSDASLYYVGVDSNPKKYSSLFLKCIKKEEPKLFATKSKPFIKRMPPKDKYFINYEIKINGQEIIFQFSQYDITIENIYLPDGESIYDLVDRRCGKKETTERMINK
jgi:hypothetical protein